MQIAAQQEFAMVRINASVALKTVIVLGPRVDIFAIQQMVKIKGLARRRVTQIMAV